MIYSLTKNDRFVDGNKRIGFVAMDTFQRVNGWRIIADVDNAYQARINPAAGAMSREGSTAWVTAHCHRLANITEKPTHGA